MGLFLLAVCFQPLKMVNFLLATFQESSYCECDSHIGSFMLFASIGEPVLPDLTVAYLRIGGEVCKMNNVNYYDIAKWR